MDLSGQLIKGTGSYEVKEIAPPVESGQLIPNYNFATGDFTNWTPSANWSIVANPLGGYMAYADESLGAGNLISDYGITPGRSYNLKFKISGSDEAGTLYIYGLGDDPEVILNTENKVHDYYLVGSAGGTFYIRATSNFSGNIEWIILEEVPEGYPLMDKGDTFLECTSVGTVAFPSNQAYGEWEFNVFKYDNDTAPRVDFISDTLDFLNGYTFAINSSESIRIRKATAASESNLFYTVASYVDTTGWYRIKITRTLDGKLYVYVRGGYFGANDWTLVDVSGGSGTNPVTDNTHTESQYFVIDLDVGDRITNIIMRKGVQQ